MLRRAFFLSLLLSSLAMAQTRRSEQIVIDSVADFATLRFRPVSQFDGRVVQVKGDRGGKFVYDFDATDTVDNGIVFDGPDSVGRFVRQWGGEAVRLVWFGVVGDGVADDGPKINAAANAARAANANLTDSKNQQALYSVSETLDLRDLNVRIGGRIHVAESHTGVGVLAGGGVREYDGHVCDIKVWRPVDVLTWNDGSIGVKIKRARNSTFRFEIRGFDTGLQLSPYSVQGVDEGNRITFCEFDRNEIVHCRVCLHLLTEPVQGADDPDHYITANQWRGGNLQITRNTAPGIIDGEQRCVVMERAVNTDIENLFDAVNFEADPVACNAGAIMIQSVTADTTNTGFTRATFSNIRCEAGTSAQLNLIDVNKLTEIEFEYYIIDTPTWYIREQNQNNNIMVRKRAAPKQTQRLSGRWALDSDDDVHFPDDQIFFLTTGAELIDIFEGSPKIQPNGELRWTSGDQGVGTMFTKKFPQQAAFIRSNSSQLIALTWGLNTDSAGDLAFVDSNPDTITRATGSFVDDGFQVGQVLTIHSAEDSGNNDNDYVIANVTATTITLSASDSLIANAQDSKAVIGFEVPIEPLSVSPATMSGFSFGSDEIGRGPGNWADDGFAPGMLIEVTGSENGGENDGIYTIASLSGDAMTLVEGDELVSNVSDETATVSRYGVISGREVVGRAKGWRIKSDWLFISPEVTRIWIGYAPWSFFGDYAGAEITSLTENYLQRTPSSGYIVQTFADGDTSPSVANGTSFETANTTSTTINDIDDAVEGERFTVWINDAFTTITDGAFLDVEGTWTEGSTGFILFEKRGTVVREVTRSTGGGGGGDVTKDGPTVNNQIGVWTGDGTIEGVLCR